MNTLDKVTLTLVEASKGSPVTAIAVIMLFYLMFNLLEAMIEKLIFGERFEHWLDPIFICLFIAYAGYAVFFCAAYQLSKQG